MVAEAPLTGLSAQSGFLTTGDTTSGAVWGSVSCMRILQQAAVSHTGLTLSHKQLFLFVCMYENIAIYTTCQFWHWVAVQQTATLLSQLKAAFVKLCSQMVSLKTAWQLHTPAIKEPLGALQVVRGWDRIHFNRLREPAVDYMGTLEQLSCQDVGSSCPWSLRAQFHCWSRK